MAVLKPSEPNLANDIALSEAQKLSDETPMARKWRIIWKLGILAVLIAVGALIYTQSMKPTCRRIAGRAVLMAATGNAESLDDDLAYPYKERLADGLYDEITSQTGADLKDYDTARLYQEISLAWDKEFHLDRDREKVVDFRSLKVIEADTAWRIATDYEKQGVDPDSIEETAAVRFVVTMPYGLNDAEIYPVTVYMVKIEGKWKALSINGLPYQEMVLDLVQKK